MNLQEIKEVLKTEGYDFLKTDKNLGDNIMLLTITGSHGRGTDIIGSDLDIRGITMENPTEIIGLGKFERFGEDMTDTDTVIYGLKKAVKLMLECNPNIIELFGTKEEHVLICNEYGQLLKDNIDLFLSQKVIKSFGGFAKNEISKARFNQYRLEGEKIEKARKSVAIAINLLIMGAEIIDGRGVNTYRHKERQLLRDIRTGVYSLAEALEISRKYEDDFRYAIENTDLQEEPNYIAVENLMMDMYRRGIINANFN